MTKNTPWNFSQSAYVVSDSGTADAWVGPLRARHGAPRATRKVETVLICDYNGWNDAPEEVREWFDEHPEIWAGSIPAADVRPIRVTPATPVRRLRGGMAA